MRLIKQSFEILDQQDGLEGVYKQIELAGRTCYKSEYKITPDSAKKFVERMIKSGHGAMLEHGTIYLMIDCSGGLSDVANKYVNNKYSKWFLHRDGKHYCITTNYRVLVENGWLDDLKYLCKPTEFHEKRITVKFICDRGVSHEFVRHRVFSFAQESTRYCNYTKDKFGGEITFIIPNWLNIDEGIITTDSFGGPVKPVEETYDFLYGLGASEKTYFRLIHRGWKPQEARQVLPNSLKTELIMTGFIGDWVSFFDLRALGTTGIPHPLSKELAEALRTEFIKRGYIDN